MGLVSEWQRGVSDALKIGHGVLEHREIVSDTRGD